MKKLSKKLWLKIHDAAKKAVPLYVQGMLSEDALSQLIAQEWRAQYAEHYESSQKEEEDSEEEEEVQPPFKLLWHIAQRISSRMLHDTWCSRDAPTREQAYINLNQYFTDLLHHVRYTKYLQKYDQTIEDAV